MMMIMVMKQVLKDDWVATAPGVQRARAGLDEGEGVGGAGGVDDAELEFARGLVLQRTNVMLLPAHLLL